MKGAVAIFWTWCGGLLCAQGAVEQPAPDWRRETYEPVVPTLASPLQDATLTVSGQWSDRGPQFVVDGKIEANNHWACEKLPAVLTVEMRARATLASCRIWPFFGEPRVYKFYIEASPDGQAWTRVVDWTNNERPATAEGFAIPFERPVLLELVRRVARAIEVKKENA